MYLRYCLSCTFAEHVTDLLHCSWFPELARLRMHESFVFMSKRSFLNEARGFGTVRACPSLEMTANGNSNGADVSPFRIRDEYSGD